MESAGPFFKRISIIGLGLLGGSWALSLERVGCDARRVGCDRAEVLQRALRSGAIHEAFENAHQAVQSADLVILATPVGKILDLLGKLKSSFSAYALVTDVGSTKQQIVERTRDWPLDGPLFLGGHPLAGKEQSGFEHAESALFQNACYALVPAAPEVMNDQRVKAFVELVSSIGARPYLIDAASHDRAVAYLSHMPQLLSTGLAGLVAEKAGLDGLPLELAGPGFRDLTRLAESPYDMWRDICLTNGGNIRSAIDAMIQKLDTVKLHLSTRELEKEFDRARELRRMLRERD